VTVCPSCGADSELSYRCSECGKDLVDVDDDDEDDEDRGAAPLLADGGHDYVLVPKYAHNDVYHDPDPDDPDEPKCDRADAAAHEWRRRDPRSLADRYSYCQYCDPEAETRRGYGGGPTLAKRLADRELDDDERPLVTDGGVDGNASGGSEWRESCQ